MEKIQNLCLRDSEYHVTLPVESFFWSKITEEYAVLTTSSERGGQVWKEPP